MNVSLGRASVVHNELRNIYEFIKCTWRTRDWTKPKAGKWRVGRCIFRIIKSEQSSNSRNSFHLSSMSTGVHYMLENECVTRSVWFYDNLPELQLLSVAAVKCGFSYCDDDGEERQLTRCTSLLPDAKYPESWKPSDTVQLPVSRILLSVQQTYIQISTYDVFPVWHGRRDIHHEFVWINNTSPVDVCIENRCVGSVGRHSDAHRVSTGRMRTPCHILCESACNDTWSWTGLHTHAWCPQPLYTLFPP